MQSKFVPSLMEQKRPHRSLSLSLLLRLVCFSSRYWAICRAYVYYAHCQIITRDSRIIVPVESNSLGDWRERKHTRTRIELLFLVIADFLSHLSRSGDYKSACELQRQSFLHRHSLGCLYRSVRTFLSSSVRPTISVSPRLICVLNINSS